jgi:hypothetical protein
MTDAQIASLLDVVCSQLTAELQAYGALDNAKKFETRVRQVLAVELAKVGKVLRDFADQDFPDIVVDDWGIEVKHTKEDKWRTVANSVFEGHRRDDVSRVFIVFAKLGGTPAVRWADYASSVVHVRTSHRPRYEVEVGATKSLFEQMGVSYADFRAMPEREKMVHIRKYARSRLKAGEQLWWLGDDPENPHSLPLEVRLYPTLSDSEKRRLRAEVTFLFPEVLKGSRVRDKYSKAALHLLTYRGVLTSQARDLFSAGSVAGKERGGNYLLRAFADLLPEFLDAARRLDPALLQEYWGHAPQTVAGRLSVWAEQADKCAAGWKPSELLQDYLKSVIPQPAPPGLPASRPERKR